MFKIFSSKQTILLIAATVIAIPAYFWISTSQEVGKLVKELKSDDPEIRLAAAERLGELGSRSDTALKALSSAAHDPDPDIRSAAITSLSQLNPDTAAKALLRAYRHGSRGVQLDAQEALERMGHREAISIIERDQDKLSARRTGKRMDEWVEKVRREYDKEESSTERRAKRLYNEK